MIETGHSMPRFLRKSSNAWGRHSIVFPPIMKAAIFSPLQSTREKKILFILSFALEESGEQGTVVFLLFVMEPACEYVCVEEGGWLYPPPPHLCKDDSILLCTIVQLSHVCTANEGHVLSPNSYIHVSVRDSCIPIIGLPILLQPNMWTDPGNI